MDIKHNQSIFDIALQYYGTIEVAFDIALVNDISLTTNIEGLTLVDADASKDSRIVDFFNGNDIVLGTEIKKRIFNSMFSPVFN